MTAATASALPVSRIGLGCYRMRADHASHRAALRLALESGCRLVDTASNYGDGLSEQLVGELTADTCGDVQVITKAGYLSPSLTEELASAGLTSTPSHSVDPAVLRVSLELSIRRLRGEAPWSALLHNPEKSVCGNDDVDPVTALEPALAFLQGQVDRGNIRSFGVSSNRLTMRARTPGRLSLPALLDAAEDNGLTGFRVVEMPCNLLERGSIEAEPGCSESLREHAARRGVDTVANRPINTVDGDTARRLASYPPPDPGLEASLASSVETITHAVSDRLATVGERMSWRDFPAVRFLQHITVATVDPDMLDLVFDNQLRPFLRALFDGDVPPNLRDLVDSARDAAHRRLLPATCVGSEAAHHDSTAAPAVDARTAVAFPLERGFDRVLVGMRSTAYVRDLLPTAIQASTSRAGGS